MEILKNETFKSEKMYSNLFIYQWEGNFYVLLNQKSKQGNTYNFISVFDTFDKAMKTFNRRLNRVKLDKVP